MNRLALFAIALLVAAGSAQAQKKVFRCEVGGKVTYADAPCKDGVDVKADDARSDVQRKAAQDVVKREEKMADQLGRERRASEQEAARHGAAGIPHSAAQKAASAPDKPPKPPRPKRVVRVQG
jgi:Skp family chaperone for outer membrane proteins